MQPEPIFAPSARRHGVQREDAFHAYRNPIAIFGLDDEMDMHIGPDRSARLLEVGVVSAADGTPVIVHAMQARPKFLR